MGPGEDGYGAAWQTFRDALETQYVCDAVLKSAREGHWEKVKHAADLK